MMRGKGRFDVEVRLEKGHSEMKAIKPSNLTLVKSEDASAWKADEQRHKEERRIREEEEKRVKDEAERRKAFQQRMQVLASVFSRQVVTMRSQLCVTVVSSCLRLCEVLVSVVSLSLCRFICRLSVVSLPSPGR